MFFSITNLFKLEFIDIYPKNAKARFNAPNTKKLNFFKKKAYAKNTRRLK